jgi:hypothetical protein
VAAVLEISEETVTRDWRMAKIWLKREIERNTAGGEPTAGSPQVRPEYSRSPEESPPEGF